MAPGALPERQAFIVVSTGQNHANLPPVLECAEEGDVVVWVESDLARKEQWSRGARQVFHDHGLLNYPAKVKVSDINDPVQVSNLLEPIVAELAPSHRLNLVMNGGQKLTPLGLMGACREFESRLLYGQPKPAELWIFDNAMERPPERQPYRRHRLELADLLSERGLLAMDTPQRLWPMTEAPERPRYGADPDYTRQVHGQYHRWHWWKALEPQTSPDEIDFNVLHALFQEAGIPRRDYENWLKALGQVFERGWGQSREQPKAKPPTSADTASRLDQMPRILGRVYRETLRFARRATEIKTRFDDAVEPSERDVGKAFERAVAYRLFALLQSRPEWADVVCSAWTGVKLARIDSPHLCQAEWDLVIVLRNAVLLQIECKSAGTAFNTEQKSLDAQLLNLLRAGSQGEMLICGPLYSTSADQPWFANHQHALREKVGPRDFLPFTLPGQPETYEVRNPQGKTESHPCPSFETVLTRRLNAYVPGDSGG